MGVAAAVCLGHGGCSGTGFGVVTSTSQRKHGFRGPGGGTHKESPDHGWPGLSRADESTGVAAVS
ncbi:hypothetical protein roselon_02821 [Roseibacterium elongatum DSM 19469]|uniref:Uncharacterized protein n=1 Tax=Roseicyclus elongatus DSM 19469 TaxID=1294273 RepID=W8RV89_9RHOB|nr:hypothetical protein roselon_02821 [Roseibacterium elongatum DSM 19469]